MASHCYVDPPVFSNYVGSYNECMDDIANVMENSNNDTTLKHAMVKSQCMHRLQKQGYVPLHELISVALKHNVDEYYIEKVLLRDLPVVIITVRNYSKLKYGNKQKCLLLTSFPDDMDALKMKKWSDFIADVVR
eukprot:83728_1